MGKKKFKISMSLMTIHWPQLSLRSSSIPPHFQDLKWLWVYLFILETIKTFHKNIFNIINDFDKRSLNKNISNINSCKVGNPNISTLKISNFGTSTFNTSTLDKKTSGKKNIFETSISSISILSTSTLNTSSPNISTFICIFSTITISLT